MSLGLARAVTAETMDDPVRIRESNCGQVLRSGDWAWSVDHEQIARVVETQTLWGDSIVSRVDSSEGRGRPGAIESASVGRRERAG